MVTGQDDGSLNDVIETTVLLGPQDTETLPIVKPKSSPIAGVVYRDPTPPLLKVCKGTNCTPPTLNTSVSPNYTPIGETLIALQPVNIPQLGRYVVMPLKNHWLDNNNIAITFAANGVPTSLAYGKQSTILALSTILNSAGSSGNGSGGSGSGSGKGGK